MYQRIPPQHRIALIPSHRLLRATSRNRVALLVVAVVLTAAAFLTIIWLGTTPAGAQDGYEPDEQLIDDVRGYARETDKGYDHVLRWMRVLHTFDALDDVTAAEAQDYADNGWQRWDPVVAALAELEDAPGDYQPDEQLVDDVRGYARETEKGLRPRAALDAGAAYLRRP